MEWCNKRELNLWATENKVVYQISSSWYYLTASGDPFFYDLFIEGLHSQNGMIVASAAQGLAKLRDARAIEPLIATGRHAAGEALFAIGESLLYFPDPQAQAGAEEILNSMNENVEALRQQIKEKGFKILFQW